MVVFGFDFEFLQGTSDLSGLIQVMTSVFMETTPLNSVSAGPPLGGPGATPYPLNTGECKILIDCSVK
jgi:hypothetical protein